MISRAVASALLAARHQASFISLALPQTTAPTLCRPAVTSASRSLRARPPLPTHAAAGRVCPSAALTGLVAAMPASRDFKGILRKRLPIFMLGADHAFQASFE